MSNTILVNGFCYFNQNQGKKFLEKGDFWVESINGVQLMEDDFSKIQNALDDLNLLKLRVDREFKVLLEKKRGEEGVYFSFIEYQ